jgi:hypothetical protein
LRHHGVYGVTTTTTTTAAATTTTATTTTATATTAATAASARVGVTDSDLDTVLLLHLLDFGEALSTTQIDTYLCSCPVGLQY